MLYVDGRKRVVLRGGRKFMAQKEDAVLFCKAINSWKSMAQTRVDIVLS